MKTLVEMIAENRDETQRIVENNNKMIGEYGEQNKKQNNFFETQDKINQSNSKVLAQVLLKQAKVEKLVMQANNSESEVISNV